MAKTYVFLFWSVLCKENLGKSHMSFSTENTILQYLVGFLQSLKNYKVITLLSWKNMLKFSRKLLLIARSNILEKKNSRGRFIQWPFYQICFVHVRQCTAVRDFGFSRPIVKANCNGIIFKLQKKIDKSFFCQN